ncbi:MAG: hypothetical protein LC737_09175, partial [Chloroflexi bacterium]|nr:hypothetical protein [Chloroflexota bacterium]
LTIEQVNKSFRDAAAGAMQGILAVTDDELVSGDFVGDTHSAVVDAKSTMTAGPLVKVQAWYDNEWGYANRVADLAQLISEQRGVKSAKAKAERQSVPLTASK